MGRIMLPEVIEKLQRLIDLTMTQSVYEEPGEGHLPTLKWSINYTAVL